MKLPLAALALLATPAFAVVNIDYVTVGNVGNAADPATGSLYGAVAYAYKIAKNETTIAQYAEFLNAVAKSDSYGLYSTSMTTGTINGISRSGSDGSYIYTVNPGSGNRPIFARAARGLLVRQRALPALLGRRIRLAHEPEQIHRIPRRQCP
jgi:hypothetical protein